MIRKCAEFRDTEESFPIGCILKGQWRSEEKSFDCMSPNWSLSVPITLDRASDAHTVKNPETKASGPETPMQVRWHHVQHEWPKQSYSNGIWQTLAAEGAGFLRLMCLSLVLKLKVREMKLGMKILKVCTMCQSQRREWWYSMEGCFPKSVTR